MVDLWVPRVVFIVFAQSPQLHRAVHVTIRSNGEIVVKIGSASDAHARSIKRTENRFNYCQIDALPTAPDDWHSCRLTRIGLTFFEIDSNSNANTARLSHKINQSPTAGVETICKRIAMWLTPITQTQKFNFKSISERMSEWAPHFARQSNYVIAHCSIEFSTWKKTKLISWPSSAHTHRGRAARTHSHSIAKTV